MESYDISEIILLTLMFLVLIFGLLILLGVFDSSLDKLNIDKDKLVSDYVKEYYPEFINCTIEYNDNFRDGIVFVGEGVDIYCSELDSRDSMSSLKGDPDEVLVFQDNLTLKKIFEQRLLEAGLK